MKSIKYLIVFVVVFLSCKNTKHKYPNLKSGMYADIETNRGDVLIRLHYKKVPLTVANFVALSEGDHPKLPDSLKGKPFYNGLVFHRVVEDFMIETGKPQNPYQEDLGYFFADELREDLKHDSIGIVSMSNDRKIYTNSTRFFITRKATDWLDGFTKSGEAKPCGKYGTACHTVFGKVVKGFEILDSIQQNDTIRKIRILRTDESAKSFEAAATYSELSEKSVPFEIKMGVNNAKETISGLKFLALKKGNGRKVNPALQTEAHYTLYNTNGKLLASSIRKNKPIVFTINNDALIAGWKEGAKLLHEGGKARLFIPSYLAYGNVGSPTQKGKEQLVKPNEDLVFEIEILKVGK